jgi:hypothetical protein
MVDGHHQLLAPFEVQVEVCKPLHGGPTPVQLLLLLMLFCARQKAGKKLLLLP